MKYLILQLLLLAALQCTAQTPVNLATRPVESEKLHLRKSYKGATIVELSGVAIAFAGGSLHSNPAGRGAFVMFGSSLALGGLLFSLFNGPSTVDATPAKHNRLQLNSGNDGIGVKMKF